MRVIPLMFCVLALGACATTMRLVPTPEANSDVSWDRGVGSVISSASASAVVFEAAERDFAPAARIAVRVTVRNRLDRPLEVSTATMSARSGTLPLEVATPEQMHTEMQAAIKQQRIAAALTMIGDGLATMSAPTPAAAATAQNQQNYNNAVAVRNIREMEADALLTQDVLFQRQTLAPMGFYSGIIYVQAPPSQPSPQPIDVAFDLAGERHVARFLYTQTPSK